MKYIRVNSFLSEVEELIKLANSVPFRETRDLPDWRGLVKKAANKLRQKAQLSPVKRTALSERDVYECADISAKAIDAALEDLQTETEKYPDFYHYLFVESNFSLEKYEDFPRLQDAVYFIAGKCMMSQAMGGDYSSFKLIESAAGSKKPDATFSVQMGFSGNGKISFSSRIVDAFQNLDSERIRICPVCQKIFWAKRMNSQGEIRPCASIKCVNRFRKTKRQIEGDEKNLKKSEKIVKNYQAKLDPENTLIIDNAEKMPVLIQKLEKEYMKNGTKLPYKYFEKTSEIDLDSLLEVKSELNPFDFDLLEELKTGSEEELIEFFCNGFNSDL